jgi:adenylate kinase family enzyme
VGELLIKQIENKLELGYEIKNQIKDLKYADDKIVIDIVLKKINEIR